MCILQDFEGPFMSISTTFTGLFNRLLLNKSHFHIHLLSTARGPWEALKLPQPVWVQPAARWVWMYTGQKCGNHLVDLP